MQPPQEVVVFPDAESVVVAYFAGADFSHDVEVLTRVPNPRPGAFIRVVRTGGRRTNLVTDSAELVIEAWADSDPAAAGLGELARGHLLALPHTFVTLLTPTGDTHRVWVRRVEELAGLQSFPDPESGHPRYQFSVQVDTRGRRLTG